MLPHNTMTFDSIVMHNFLVMRFQIRWNLNLKGIIRCDLRTKIILASSLMLMFAAVLFGKQDKI
jgi:hypothetical protein